MCRNANGRADWMNIQYRIIAPTFLLSIFYINLLTTFNYAPSWPFILQGVEMKKKPKASRLIGGGEKRYDAPPPPFSWKLTYIL